MKKVTSIKQRRTNTLQRGISINIKVLKKKKKVRLSPNRPWKPIGL
jgi:hypothetical protein